MPTGYVKKLAKKHGVSTSTAEKHWGLAKAAAKKEGHGEDYGYVTSIFKNMMHENCFIPTLKDLTQGMTFKYFLIAEADEEAMAAAPPEKQRSPAYQHLADKFPQFMELSFKARRELEKEAAELLDGYDMLDQEEKESTDDYLHDLVVDKMRDEVGAGVNFRDWNKEDEEYKRRKAEFDQEQSDIDDASAALRGGNDDHSDVDTTLRLNPEKLKRRSGGPRHLAAMRQQNIPLDRAAFAPAGSDEVGAPVKSYYKSWKDMTPEQRAKASGHAKKHGTLYYVRNQEYFKTASPEVQQAIIAAVKNGASRADARKIAANGGQSAPGPVVGESFKARKK